MLSSKEQKQSLVSPGVLLTSHNLFAKKQSYPSLQKTNWWLLANQSWCKHWINRPLMKKCYTFLWKVWRHITRFVKESTRSHWLKPDCSHQWFYWKHDSYKNLASVDVIECSQFVSGFHRHFLLPFPPRGEEVQLHGG